ncbi:MAG: prenyltransferase/squalene oxidase repeat-containing protein, partial [Planctomycetia bacterium]|nr:prenyltransferase/squalene oxidase repeat-containing protein [Planctomycetia bacterium]
MLEAAQRAPGLLGDSAGLVRDFVRGRINPDGGFRGRSAQSDLYYTVFGIECLISLGADFHADPAARYLQTFLGGESLDFVHLACLARCWAAMPAGARVPAARHAIIRRIGSHRSADGGYSLAV